MDVHVSSRSFRERIVLNQLRQRYGKFVKESPVAVSEIEL
jgi:hypothetical protein